MQGRHLERCNADIYVTQTSNYWLELWIINPIQRFNNLQVIILLLVLIYCCFHGSEVLLVAKVDVVKKGTLTRKECASKFKWFGMPKLTFLLLHRVVKGWVFFHLNYESDFGRVTEVSYCEGTHLLDERFPGKLHFVLPLLNQFFDLIWLQLHYATNAKLWSPLTLVKIAKDIFKVNGLLARCISVGCKINK